MPLYTYGFMDINKQYSTAGCVGFAETAAIMGYDMLQEKGEHFAEDILNTINNINQKLQNQYSAPHNCEQVPAENSAIKLAKKDVLMHFQDGEYNLYSNQFVPLICKCDMLDRIRLQGHLDSLCSGGAIAHINVGQKIDDESQIAELVKTAAKMGVVYWAINYNIQRCENGHMSVGHGEHCQVCGGKITDNFMRVVGFITNTKNWHQVRREKDYPNRVFYDAK